MFVLNRLEWLNPARDNHMLAADGRRALARDVGMSESIFAELVASRSRVGELPGLMRALSIDEDKVRREHRPELHDMESACSTCTAKRRCRRDVRSGRAPSTFQQYCPNSEVLSRLAQAV
jgi:hypothetical protein